MDLGMSFADLGSQTFNDAMYGLNTWGNFELSKKQMEWQKYAYLNKYQIAIDDLRKAGLNPLLAVKGGVQGGSPQASAHGTSNSPSRISLAASYAAAQTAAATAKNAEANEMNAETNRQVGTATAAKAYAEASLANEKESTEAELQHMYSAQAAAEREKLNLRYYEAQKNVMINEAKSKVEQAKNLSEQTLGWHYDNWKRLQEKGIYKGAAGKVLPWLDYLRKFIPFTGKK